MKNIVPAVIEWLNGKQFVQIGLTLAIKLEPKKTTLMEAICVKDLMGSIKNIYIN